jgi:hypothetical protein
MGGDYRRTFVVPLVRERNGSRYVFPSFVSRQFSVAKPELALPAGPVVFFDHERE